MGPKSHGRHGAPSRPSCSSEVPRQARRALETVVLLRRVVVVGRAEAVAEFVDERAAVPGIRDLRNRVRPQRIGPHDLGVVSRKLVYRPILQGFRRRLWRIERTDNALKVLRILVHRAAVDIARIRALLLKLPLRLHELERIFPQLAGAFAAVAVVSDQVPERIPAAVVAKRMGRGVDCRVDFEDGPRYALRIFLVVVDYRRRAVKRVKCRAHGLD